MDSTIHHTEEQRWKYFREYPFSNRALNFFVNLEIHSVDRLTKMNIQELRKYRNVGRSTVMEIRLALARMNLSLEGEPVYVPAESNEAEDLKIRLEILEEKRDEILTQIRQLKLQITAQKPLRRAPPKNPELNKKLLARWKEVRDWNIVAQEFGVTVNKVRNIVVRRFA
jgi:hypothetical protein